MTTARAAATPTPMRGSSNRWVVLVLVCIAQFMVVLDATIVNVALPAIEKGLGFSPANLQWVLNSYLLIFGGFLLLGGRAADLFGRQRLFLIGVAVFSGASLLNGLAQNPSMLIAGRALQGLGGALVSPAALSIIIATFPEGRERTRALGVWGAIAAGGSAFGLILGGVLTDLVSWQWIFFVNVPIGVAAFVLSARFVPNSKAENVKPGLDIWGALTVTGGLTVLVYAIVSAQSNGWVSGITFGLAAVAVALLAAFVAIESRYHAPLIRLGIFRVRTLLSANLALLLVVGGMYALFFFSTLYVQQILGFSPLKAGVAFLPVTVGIGAGSGLAQGFIRRTNPRTVTITGLCIAAAGMLLTTRITADGSYLTQMLPGLVVMSIGMGLTFVPLTVIATSGIDKDDAGLASGVFNTSQQVGGALGLAILATVAADRTSSLLSGGAGHATAVVDGFRLAFYLGAGLLALGAVLLITIIRARDVAQPVENAEAA
ncbi:MAG TPA: MFS transporter [Candidatus Angelobacter sp.]|jgi:EmrB/QacA subfamily drug resistance transporter|nr:MFS transporter [Candidatus Angelobacter sp.]